ncbi:Mitochondrial_import inner membrane translocase subunit TIM14 [Hexamita inflata]|uniref:Mitochondrial_import inner membrane translocase subunit TIM14 n=1 Tax=Hexamita inflata TaxID=28002 RepID=A0ABP1I7H8_9EUKA
MSIRLATAAAIGLSTGLLLRLAESKSTPQWPRKYQGDIPKMSKKTAKMILNLPQFPTQAQTKANYRALLTANHPDRGGSVYLSQLITEAFREMEK